MMQISKSKGKKPIEGNATPDLFLGMEFESKDQAYDFYNEYATKVRFGILKRNR